MTGRRGLYLYAVVGSDIAGSYTGVGVHDAMAGDVLGVDDAPVETIKRAGLGAVVSEVGLDRLAAVVDGSDPQLLAGLAQRHHAVVLAAMDVVDRLLPLRLGTVLTGRDAADDFLDRRAGELSAALREVSACREWGVTINVSDTGEQVPASATAEPGTGSDTGVGTAYLLRRRGQLLEDERRRVARADSVAAVAETVRAVAVRVAAGRPGGGVLLDETYLVPHAAESRFLSIVDGCGDRLGEHGLRLRVTGPWPPYSFVPATLRAVT